MDATAEAIAQLAGSEEPLLIYCGAGVSIDRTGLTWSGLVRSCYPGHYSKYYRHGPRKSDVDALMSQPPDQLASSLIYTLRQVARVSKSSLQYTLRERLRTSLYGNKSTWQAGRLATNIVYLAIFRALDGRETTILTTNYDDHLEHQFDAIRSYLEPFDGNLFPGLEVTDPDGRLIRLVSPVGKGPEKPVELVYLHGRVPRRGAVNWPIVLDENSYAATSKVVGDRLQRALIDHPLTLILGSSLSDLPLIRALSSTRNSGRRLALLTKHAIADDLDSDGNSLSLDLLRHRTSELAVIPLLADFHGQVAQVVHELALRTAFPSPLPSVPRTLDYSERLGSWWNSWKVAAATNKELPEKLALALDGALPLFGLETDQDPFQDVSETYRLELWVRAYPERPERQLVRWATSDGRALFGVKGKNGRIESPSYLAPVRAFAEGRSQAFDIQDLEDSRVSTLRYTSKSFLAVPIRVNDCIVGVLSLASTNHLKIAGMMSSHDVTSQTVEYLTDLGTSLLAA